MGPPATSLPPESVPPPAVAGSPAASAGRWRSWALGLAAGYALLATAWIAFSDEVLGLLVPDPGQLVRWSMYKGLAFVATTSVLLLLALRRAIRAIEQSQAALRAHEAELERSQRLYAALSQINQAIVRVPARDELFRRICRALVEQGGFRLAWIGWHLVEEQRLEPCASWGDDQGYLRTLRIYTDDRPEGRGPSGTAFRLGVRQVSNDYDGDARTLPWHAEAARRGIRAAAAFPIRFRGEVQATLNVYSDEKNFFQEREITLLEETAADISFALDNFAREAERRAAETRARQERDFSDAMIESMPGIVYFYDAQGRFLRWNRNFEEATGRSGAEIARMHPLDFFPPADRPRVQERIAEVFARGESSVEARFLVRDGTAPPHFFTGRRVLHEGRECLVGVGIDIADRLRAEEELARSEQRYRTTLDHILEGCQLLDFDWRYLYLNHAASQQNRRPNSELLGRTMPEMWPGIEQTGIFGLLRRCLEERIGLHEETEFVFPDGSSGWFDVRCQPVPEGIFVLSIDISERRHAEAALREANATLERKVAGRTGELQAALVRAEAADRIKSAFLATMSHELRTPLNSIIGFTGILLQGLAGPLNAEQAKQLGMVRGSARHLLELINDVLDLSKIEAGQLEMRAEPFALPAVLAYAGDLVRPLAAKKGLALDVAVGDGVGPMVGDRRRVEQILLNLLNNAVKFTERGGVALAADLLPAWQPAAGAAPRPGVRLRVTDTGIGIRPEDLPLLFQPFRQIDTGLTRLHEGTGLGLAICRRLATLMGGDIAVTSAWAGGSTFTVTLPLQPPPPPP